MMELPMDYCCLLFYILAIIHTGWSQKCEVQVVNTKVFAPIDEWVLLNCTYTCAKPSWKSRLQKRNLQEGKNWVSTEVLVNNWENSTISCIADEGILPSTLTVQAYALPSKVTMDLEVELEEGIQHEVTCTVFEVAPLANLRISVMREGREIDSSTFAGETMRGQQSLSETYYFTVSRRDHLQDFYCQATLELEEVEDNIVESTKVTVKTFAKPEFPTITITPNATVKEGKSVTLTCKSEGFPEPEYSWDIPSGAPVTYSQDYSEVIITKATFAHKGTYLCMAKNQHGRVREYKSLDIIKNPGAKPDTPLLSAFPAQTVREGQSLNLTCHSDGFPEPDYTWTIPSKDHVTFSKDKRELFINSATSAHNGTYHCEAKNTHGKVSNLLIIKIIGLPNGAFHTWPTNILFASALAVIMALI